MFSFSDGSTRMESVVGDDNFYIIVFTLPLGVTRVKVYTHLSTKHDRSFIAVYISSSLADSMFNEWCLVSRFVLSTKLAQAHTVT